MSDESDAPSFQPLKGPSFSDEIINQIRNEIAHDRLKVGDRLPAERDLAEQFKVSRNTLRQALRSLSKVGLLEIRKGVKGGAYITAGGGDAVRTGITDMYSLGTISTHDLTEVRILIGVEVVRLACERRTDEELKQLSDNIGAAEDAASRDDRAARMQVNLDFHRQLARMTKNAMLMILTDALLVAVTQYVANLGGPSSNEFVMPLRPALLDSITRRDSDSAVAAMRDHLVKLHAHYLECEGELAKETA